MNGTTADQVVEETEKDKKRRRRPNRRPKQNLAALPGVGFNSVDGIVGQPPEWAENGGSGSGGPSKPFNSLPNMYVDSGLIGPAPPLACGDTFTKSCPLPASSSSSSPAFSHPMRATNRVQPSGTRRHFAPHWSADAVEDAMEKGRAFKAKFRVNAHNRLEAYCTIDGLPVDVLIGGAAAQNRAIEGDVVAIMLDPVASWTRLKGSNVSINSHDADDSSVPLEIGKVGNNFTGKEQVDDDSGCQSCSTVVLPPNRVNGFLDSRRVSEALRYGPENFPGISGHWCNGHTAPEGSNGVCASEQHKPTRALDRIRAMLSSYPLKRPTGKVLAIIKHSPRRGAVIGFLDVNQSFPEEEIEVCGKQIIGALSKKNKNATSLHDKDFVQLIPTDSKFPRMVVSFRTLPDFIKERVKNGASTVEKELIAARIDEWTEGTLYPQAQVVHILGRSGEIEPQIAAIMFENAITAANFSSESLACLPDVPWEIPIEEIKDRKDLRAICTFTIDPSSATDLDDALSVEVVSNELLRIGVHIADVSYFITPDTALDIEAQVRSTSVYILQHKLPMLPSRLCEELGSFTPGVDRLAFSIIWDVDRSGNIIHRQICRSVIQSCCKLSYEFVQNIINGSLEARQISVSGNTVPQLHGLFEWKDVISSLRSLYEISMKLKEIRFKDGALSLDNAKLYFLFDECGSPCDSFLNERMESCFLVEEFMLLANRSVAEVISRAFPDCALLRRHPEPNVRKLKEFEAFCSKHGFELDVSSSGQLHLSLSRIKEKLKNDSLLFDILVFYASKPMQSATYFCTGDLKGIGREWAHYALSVPFYTHFTCPLRRYPDIIVHRTLLAALDAEEIYLNRRKMFLTDNEVKAYGNEFTKGCFTGLRFDKEAAESKEGREALSAAAFKHRVPGTELLAEVAAYCNERKLNSKLAEEAGVKVYLWALLKKREVLVSEARVMGLGPRFLSVYIHMLSMERRIYYDDVEALSVEWFETTGTVVLDLLGIECFVARGSPGKFRSIEDVALLMNPSEVFIPEDDEGTTEGLSAAAGLLLPGPAVKNGIMPAPFPLTLRSLSFVPVALHAVGGDGGPLDIGVRLYMSSYFS